MAGWECLRKWVIPQIRHFPMLTCLIIQHEIAFLCPDTALWVISFKFESFPFFQDLSILIIASVKAGDMTDFDRCANSGSCLLASLVRSFTHASTGPPPSLWCWCILLINLCFSFTWMWRAMGGSGCETACSLAKHLSKHFSVGFSVVMWNLCLSSILSKLLNSSCWYLTTSRPVVSNIRPEGQ